MFHSPRRVFRIPLIKRNARKYIRNSALITIRRNNDLTNALEMCACVYTSHTSHEPWAEHNTDGIIRICEEIYLILKLSILFWFSSMRTSRTLSRIDSVFLLLLLLLIILCRKKRLSKAWNEFWLRFFYSRQKQDQKHAPLGNKCFIYVYMYTVCTVHMIRWKMTKSRENSTIKNNAKVTQ